MVEPGLEGAVAPDSSMEAEQTTKWEYWFAFGPMSCGELNKIGKDGWELTAVIESTETRGRWMYYFKRPLPPESIVLGHAVASNASASENASK